MPIRHRTAMVAALLLIVLAACRARTGGDGPGVAPPGLALATPDSFVIAFVTSKGRFDVMARTSWSPAGTDRLYDLVRRRYYDDVYFFRAVRNFVVQFGLHGDSAVNAAWRSRRILDDSVRNTNRRGTLSFARSGANTRTVQLFINLRDNARLDTDAGFGFPPIGEVVSGMAVVDSLYMGYGEAARLGGRGGTAAQPDTTRRGPQQDSIRLKGNEYLRRGFPMLDRIVTARVVQEWRK